MKGQNYDRISTWAARGCGWPFDKEIRTYDLLDQLGIPYERVDHEALATIDACGEVDEVLRVEICKNLFLCNRQQTDFIF